MVRERVEASLKAEASDKVAGVTEIDEDAWEAKETMERSYSSVASPPCRLPVTLMSFLLQSPLPAVQTSP
jgi:hypothetical protein